MVGDRLRRPAPELEGEADAASRHGRNHARRVADQHDARRGEGLDEPAAWDAARAPLDDPRFRDIEEAARMLEEGLEVRFRPLVHGETDLRHRRSRSDPGEVSRREPAVEEAVEEPRVRVEPFVLDLEAREEAFVAAEAEGPGDGRLAAIGADEIARPHIEPRDINPLVAPLGA